MNDKLRELEKRGIYRPNRKGPLRIAMEELGVGDSFAVTDGMYTSETGLRTRVWVIAGNLKRKFSVHKSETGMLHVIRVE